MEIDEEAHLLVADDDEDIRQLLSSFLNKRNYLVSIAQNGEEALTILEQEKNIKLAILDVMMPGLDGLDVCRRIRQQSNIPIILLTAVSEETDKIIGLELGADDYITKPFNPRELLARIKAILRRLNSQTVPSNEWQKTRLNIMHFAGWKLNTALRSLISPDNIEVTLSSKLYHLLVAFAENSQRVLSRDYLLDVLSHRNAEPFDRSIDILISRLRQKLELDPKVPKLIKTVRSGGYVFSAEVIIK